MPIDYATLRFIWWILLGVLLIGFAILDGFDLGSAMLLPIVGRNDGERRVVINAVGPTWEGNQVWFILGGGAIFAAWPMLYAVSFSGFYLAMFLVLIALILRPVSFKFRSKVVDTRWRTTWDALLTLSGWVPALIFGVAVGNVLKGVPFDFDSALRVTYTGGFWDLLNPFALLCGMISVLMLLQQGGLFLAVKTDAAVQRRARSCARTASVLLIVLFLMAGWWVFKSLPGYVFNSVVDPLGPSNPLHKQIITEIGAWTHNYSAWPWLLSVPALGVIGALFAMIFAGKGQSRFAFLMSSLSIFGIVTTAGASMFPILLPSSSHPDHSLTVWDASSSQLTLFIMLLCTLIIFPVVLLYTAWVYRVLKGKVNLDQLLKREESY